MRLLRWTRSGSPLSAAWTELRKIFYSKMKRITEQQITPTLSSTATHTRNVRTRKEWEWFAAIWIHKWKKFVDPWKISWRIEHEMGAELAPARPAIYIIRLFDFYSCGVFITRRRLHSTTKWIHIGWRTKTCRMPLNSHVCDVRRVSDDLLSARCDDKTQKPW